jgi:Flp pilus assembly protein CpaB
MLPVVIAISVFVVGTVVVIFMLGLGSKEKEIPMATVVVAAKNLKSGTEISKGDVTTRDVPASTVGPSNVRSVNDPRMMGEKLNFSISKGQPVLVDYFKKDKPSKPKRLKPTWGKAVTIMEEAEIVNLPFLEPGKYVTVYSVRTTRQGNKIYETISERAKVLGVTGKYKDRKPDAMSGETNQPRRRRGPSPREETQEKPRGTVTLELRRDEAPIAAKAASAGVTLNYLEGYRRTVPSSEVVIVRQILGTQEIRTEIPNEAS